MMLFSLDPFRVVRRVGNLDDWPLCTLAMLIVATCKVVVPFPSQHSTLQLRCEGAQNNLY